jgi:methionyl-tRNA formyltransferase
VNSPAKPARLVLVTGHTFGVRAYEGIFASGAYLDRRIEVPLMIGLDGSHAAGTVGYHPAGPLAAEHGVPFVSTSDGRLVSLAPAIAAAAPDYLLVVGWSRLVPQEILAMPTAGGTGGPGCIGMHPTRLPDGRGQAPIPWTIIKGYTSTALSVFFLEQGADTGPVIAQYELAVHPRETAASLFYRIAHAHYTAGRELAACLADRGIPAVPQDEAAATRWPKRRPADGQITTAMTCQQVDALVRALLGPYPRAFVLDGDRKLPVAAARQVAAGASQVQPGWLRFTCADGVIELLVDPARE